MLVLFWLGCHACVVLACLSHSCADWLACVVLACLSHAYVVLEFLSLACVVLDFLSHACAGSACFRLVMLVLARHAFFARHACV